MSGVNPQGVHVVSFKKPSAEELDHDFLWRTTRALPERGRIGTFNRSHYEDINAFERHLDRNGTKKVSAEEHAANLLARRELEAEPVAR